MKRSSWIAVGALGVWGAVVFLHFRPAHARARFASFGQLVNPAGGTIALSDVRQRILVVNLWASWCGPCREELPVLDSLAATHDSQRVVFLALSEDVDGIAARQFLTLVGGVPHMRVGLGLGRLAQLYRYPGLPFTMLVDPDLRIRRTWIGYGGPAQIAAIDSVIRSIPVSPR